MKATTITAALLILAASLSPAYAEQYLEGHTSITRMQDVAHGHFQEAVDQMNHTYNMLAEMLDNTGKGKLNDSQVAWQKYSEADCRFTTDYSRGEPLEKLVYQDCLTSITEDRTQALEYQLRRNFTLDPSLALEKRKK